jgi:hypothetical protein
MKNGIPRTDSEQAGLKGMRTEVVYRGRQLRSSMVWLALAVFLGGSPLAVYFTMPDPKPATLVPAIVLGVPLFAMSLVDLGKSNGLILNPRTRQLIYVEGFFARRRARVYPYDDVREVHLVRRHAMNTKGAPEAAGHLRIEVGPKDRIVLEEWSLKEAARRARYLGATFGIQPRMDGEPLYVEMEAVPRDRKTPK